jgi:hypothetical protein
MSFLWLDLSPFSSKERIFIPWGSLDNIYSYQVKALLYLRVIRNTFTKGPTFPPGVQSASGLENQD